MRAPEEKKRQVPDNTSRSSFPERIAQVLADEIVERTLLSGERLQEQKLAERFGTSRAPIREALYLLVREGLVERVPRRGAVVKRYSAREIRELYKIRVNLEELALERDCDGPRMVRLSLAALEPVVRRDAEGPQRRQTLSRAQLHFPRHDRPSFAKLRPVEPLHADRRTFKDVSPALHDGQGRRLQVHRGPPAYRWSHRPRGRREGPRDTARPRDGRHGARP